MVIDKMVYNGLNFCSSDAYFIRLRNHKDYYIHQDRKTHFKLKKNVRYLLLRCCSLPF